MNFENTRKPYSSSILGLYGQNGSGKTALIDALSLLKLALTMKSVPAFFADYINVDADCATLKYEFKVTDHDPDGEYAVVYEFSIRKDVDEFIQNTDYVDGETEKYKATIFDKVLSYSYKSDGMKLKLLPVVDTRTEEVFVPKTKIYH